MSVFDRMNLPDNGWDEALAALTAPPKVIQEVKQSTPEQLKTADDEIADLEDQISNICHDVGLSVSIRYKFTACCRSCEKDYEVEIDNISQWDESMNYCGGSQYCLP